MNYNPLVFCASLERTDHCWIGKGVQSYGAVIGISNFEQLAERIASTLSKRIPIKQFHPDKIKYDIPQTSDGLLPGTTPFIKHPKFSDQKEIRAVFFPVNPNDVPNDPTFFVDVQIDPIGLLIAL